MLIMTILMLAPAPAAARAEVEADPWREFNERIHNFNDAVDRRALEPVARGWAFVLPDFAQKGLRNFFDNLDLPRTIVNDLLQAKPVSGLSHLARLALNSSVGIGGLFDPAGALGLAHDPEDFGQTLGYWGVPGGPYSVTPFLGPSNVRDSITLPFDIAASPTFWIEESLFPLTAVDIVNRRSFALEEIAKSREEAIDYYVFVRNAWTQNREKNVRDGAPPPAADDFYDTDDFYDDDDFYDTDDFDAPDDPEAGDAESKTEAGDAEGDTGASESSGDGEHGGDF